MLLVSDGNVVLTHNHTDTGPAVPIIASLLLDADITHAYIAGVRLFDSLAELNRQMQSSVPGWRMRIANRRRHAFTKDKRVRVVGRFFVDYFCIDQQDCKGNRFPRRRFDVMNLDLLYERPVEDPYIQLEMALSLLEMCEHREIAMRNTKGALGSAMLRKSPMWQKGRRSAPKFVNDHARQYLSGNFYSISRRVKSTEGLSIPHCYYLDQRSAHHNIVLSTPIPDPSSIRARGYYKHMLRGESKRWCHPDSPTGREIMQGEQIGLVCCRLVVGTIGPTIEHLYPPWARKRGNRDVWLWTPELRLLQHDHRFQLEYFSCGFTGSVPDPVLPEYAEWALSELEENPQRAGHKKGALLSAYGMLAFNGTGRHIYRYWGGENSRYKVEIPLAGVVGESRVTIPNHVELSTVNVIARGIIEAETRTRSIEYAKQLHAQGFTIPQIYADGVLVATHQLPFIDDGWRVAHSLTHVQIPRSNAIISDQIVKLPGVAGTEADREWEHRRQDAMRPLILAATQQVTPVTGLEQMSRIA